MLISCKACAAVNFIQVHRSKGGEIHCTICRKVLDLSAPELPRDPKQGFRISHHPVEIEKKFDEMNSNQRLAIASLVNSDDYEAVEIEDEEEELLDMAPSIKLPALDLADWNKARIPSLPAAAKRRQRLNQRLTLAAWIFVAGVGTAGAAGVAVASTSKTATTAPAPEKKTATAALAAIAPQQKSPASRNTPR